MRAGVLLAVALLLALLSAVAWTTFAPGPGRAGTPIPAPPSRPVLSLADPAESVGNVSSNSSNHLGNSSARFVSWFFSTLITLVGLVIAILLVGGVVNYVLVGRHRRPWAPPPGPPSATTNEAGTSAPGTPPTPPSPSASPPTTYARRRKPPLYRTARAARWLGVLATVLVVLFILSTIYSVFLFASHGQIQTGKNPLQLTELTSGAIQASFSVNITNPSYYALVLNISAELGRLSGPLLTQGTTGTVTVSPDHQPIPLAITLTIPASALSASSASLLLYNTTLQGGIWLNGSYATVYTFGLSAVANDSWGAPFHGLTVRPGTPTVAGGETSVPVALNFTDYSNFLSDNGTLTLQVVNGGSDCGGPSQVNLSAPPGEPYATAFDLTGPSSCMTPAATIETSYKVDGTTITLPSEGLS